MTAETPAAGSPFPAAGQAPPRGVAGEGRPGGGTQLTAVSLFAGIGGFDEALRRAGVDVVAAVEIDKDCRSVLARHFPETALFNDVTEVTAGEIIAAGFVPRRGILAGGWPCQDISIAGLRAGLGGARSGLFWEIVRLTRDLRPQWLVLENVDDLLSSACPCPGDRSCVANGRAVRCGKTIRGEWQPDVQHNPPGGVCPGGCMAVHGGAMGAVVGALEQLGYGLCWRVLDAQYAGVPQRRSRLFLVGCLGDGAAPVQVLLEPESSERDFEAGGQAGQGPPGDARGGPGDAGTVGTLEGTSPGGGWRVGADEAAAGQLVTGTMTAGMLGDYDDNTARQGFMVAHTSGAGWWAEGPGTLRAQGGGTDQGGHLVVPTLTSAMGSNVGHPGDAGKDDAILAVTAATLQGGGKRGHRIDAEGAAGGHLVPVVSHAITARERRGADSDATTGIIAVPVALRGRADGSQAEAGEPGDPAFAARTPGGGSSYPMVAASLTSGTAAGEGVNPPGRRQEDDVNLVTHALTSEGADASEAGTGRGTPLVPVAFATSSLDSPRDDGLAPPVKANRNGQDTGSGASVLAATAAAVRRLTPRECERLQGFPDDWTRWTADGREQSDSARYRQLGNAVAVPVTEWILRRLVAVERGRMTNAA